MPFLLKIMILFGYSLTVKTCSPVDQKNSSGVVQLKSIFYQENGLPIFIDLKKIWYYDSLTIEQVNTTNFITDTTRTTTVNYSVLLFRFIDLRNKVLYDYKNFSDTARIFYKAVLPDSFMRDFGWSYYSDKIRIIQDPPLLLSDTIINEISYKRVKFNFLFDDPKRGYKIGYLRCDRGKNMFSLEKAYSNSLNCTMSKFVEFQLGRAVPYASLEVDFLSDTLSEREIKVFNSWQKNARNNLVKK